MWEEILNLAMNNGLWAVLFMGLLIYQLKDSRTRESKYQDTITELNKTLNKVNKIDENVATLADNMVQVKEDVSRTLTCVDRLITKHEVTLEENNDKN
ncbi:MAG: hypothetical protein IJE91_03750 [Clostridia bacterium]|nr:hypothetical protein [Clostridia bacterium]